MTCDIVILAAGAGTRMQSALPKVLHVIGDKPLLAHVLDTAKELTPKRLIVVYGHSGALLLERFAREPVFWEKQEPRLGTGHALKQAIPSLASARVLVLYGDVPLISAKTLTTLLASVPEDAVGFLTTTLSHPSGFGRVERDAQGKVLRVVEEIDASHEQRKITEVNTGILVAPTQRLISWLHLLSNQNAQQEYYLTDIFSMAAKEEIPIHAMKVESQEVQGINTPEQLEKAERWYQYQQAQQLLAKGVRLRCAHRIDVRGSLRCGQDVSIDVNTIFEGNNDIGDQVEIGPHCIIKNAQIQSGAKILAFSYLEGVSVGAKAVVGPFARLRPGTVLEAHSRVGNFVEIKNTTLGEYSKANHLSYLGDATIGRSVNIGAGTITCNYDGVQKHRTIIEDEVSIGSDTQLIAPVTIGAKATIAAGTTIMKDVPPSQLVLNRKTQTVLEGWERPVQEKEKE